MTERRDETLIEQTIARLVADGRISRRSFLRRASRGGLVLGSALSLPAILAACGIKPAASNTPLPTGTPVLVGTPTPQPTPSGQLNWANWPLYIDVDSNHKHPSIEAFTQATGIKVKYTEAIQDNQSFFGTIQPYLAANKDTGWDLMVLTDWLIGKMARLGYLETVDASLIPNFAANAGEKYKNPTYDPNNAHSVPWQSGITGIGYNPKFTQRDITSFNDLFDPKFKGKVGMFTEMRDTMNLTLLGIGVKPVDATVADATKAQQKLLQQANAGIVRKYYDNSYADALAKGDIWITMAWSGDIFQLQANNPDLRFVVPQEGGILWVDNMCIPTNAKHPIDAMALMNFVYQPKIAAMLSESINYICPVPAAKDVITQDAAAAKNKDDKASLTRVANSPLVFPTPDMLSRVYSYKVLDDQEEKEWNDLFQKVVQG
jgi:spermidine/putrescine transport system substrate-binding protein